MFELTDIAFRNILDIPHLVIDTGQVTALVGPSGSGKTTILRLLNRMISPTRGHITFDGQDLQDVDAVAHRRRVVMLSQNASLFEGTVRDNLCAGLQFQHRLLPADSVLDAVLEQICLNKALHETAATLSGGERQRLALGRVLLLEPEVYLLDEPSSALDDATAALIFDMLTAHARTAGKGIVMITHSRSMARNYSDTIIEIDAGRVRGREVCAQHR